MTVSPPLPTQPWAADLKKAQAERQLANNYSQYRIDNAPYLGAMIVASSAHPVTRIAAAAAYTHAWYTDHLDGLYGRRSKASAQAVADTFPAIASTPEVTHLLGEACRDGAERDQLADKELDNKVRLGLLARAILTGDHKATAVIGLSTVIKERFRNPRMAAERERGRQHGVDVKARPLGKLATVASATGAGLMIIGRPGERTNRVGLGIMASSLVPSLAAVADMRLHVNRQIRLQSTAVAPQSASDAT